MLASPHFLPFIHITLRDRITDELGTLIKDKIIARAVSWFTGVAIDPEDDFEEEEVDDFEEEEEDDDDTEEEEDDEEEDEGVEGVEGPKSENPECKQQ